MPDPKRSVRSRTLAAGFLRSVYRDPGGVALETDQDRLTYGELYREAARIANALVRYDAVGAPLTAVFAYRSVTAFAGILAALLRGHGYVPLNRTFPAHRTARMLSRSGCSALVVDEASSPQLDDVLPACPDVRLLIAPDRDEVGELGRRFPNVKVLGAADLRVAGELPAPIAVNPQELAYLLFTSGSTGEPKGVMVSHANVLSFVDWAVGHYGITAQDRFSQMFDPTFDLSVFDMFVAWERGARVCCPPPKSLINPGRFIRERGITVWFSVPSTAIFMRRLGALKPDRYPTLRWSLFCGEPLPAEVVSAWQEAAPRSTIENLYGPTEATIACTAYRWDPEKSPAEVVHGVVPIGQPIGGMRARVVDTSLREVPVGEAGELLVAGPQVTPGYWGDPERTAASFVRPHGTGEVHYRTGDRVRRAEPPSPLVYLGRLDHQIQVLGHRVELAEVEAVLREESGEDAVIALGWPRTPSGASGVVAFIGAASVNTELVLQRVARRLPDYMVPRKIHVRSSLPLNPNGKYDRKALMRELKEGE